MSVVAGFTSSAQNRAHQPSWKETITGLRRTVVGRGSYDLCLEVRAVREVDADDFNVSIAFLRVATDNGGGRKEGNFPEEFRRAGATVKEKAPAVVVLREIKLKEGLSKQEAELEVSKLAQKLKQGDGYADSLVEEMGYTEAIERTKPAII